MRSCAGDRGKAVGCQLSAVCFTQAGGRRESRQRLATFSLKSPCALSEAMHKMKCLISPWGDTICLRQQAIIFACGAGEDSPLNPLSFMNS